MRRVFGALCGLAVEPRRGKPGLPVAGSSPSAVKAAPGLPAGVAAPLWGSGPGDSHSRDTQRSLAALLKASRNNLCLAMAMRPPVLLEYVGDVQGPLLALLHILWMLKNITTSQ